MVVLREAAYRPDRKVAAIIRGGEIPLPCSGDTIRPGGRIIVIGSPHAARSWSVGNRRGATTTLRDVVVYGSARRASRWRASAAQGIHVRIVEAVSAAPARP